MAQGQPQFPHRIRGDWGESPIFPSKNARGENGRKLFRHNGQGGPEREWNECLTEKKGVFWGCFAEKRGSALKKIALFFEFSRFFGIFATARRWRARRCGGGNPPKKIVPKNLW
jgi:hypothetical protein